MAEKGSPEGQNLWTREKGFDWPRMLGSEYDSTSHEKGILTNWPSKGLRVVWTHGLGEGYGIGVASQGRWFQFDRFGDSERLTCHLAETGKVLWEKEYPVVYSDAYGYNNGPRSSPVVDGDRVYIYGVTGRLTCLSVTDGKEIWTRDVNHDCWVVPNFFGVGASPLIYGDHLWAMVGGSLPDGRDASRLTINDVPRAKPNHCGMVAFDKRTGEIRHKIGNYLASYSAPVVRKIGGRDTCLALMREGLLTFDPADGGDEQFIPWRASSLESVNGASPVLIQDHVLIGEAYEKGGLLAQKTATGELESVWEDGKLRRDQLFRPHWTNPLVVGDKVFVSSGRNEPDTDLRCVQYAKEDRTWSGKLRWAVRNRDRMTGIAIDNHLLMLGESGALQLLAINSDKMEVVSTMELTELPPNPVSRSSLGTPYWAPPVVSHGLLFVRASDRIICLELIPQ